jgi:hypothetical protein
MVLSVTPRPLRPLKKLSGVVFDPWRNPVDSAATPELMAA